MVAPKPAEYRPAPSFGVELPSTKEPATCSRAPSPLSKSHPASGRQIADIPPWRKPVTRLFRMARLPRTMHTPETLTEGTWVSVTSQRATLAPLEAWIRQSVGEPPGSRSQESAAEM